MRDAFFFLTLAGWGLSLWLSLRYGNESSDGTSTFIPWPADKDLVPVIPPTNTSERAHDGGGEPARRGKEERG